MWAWGMSKNNLKPKIQGLTTTSSINMVFDPQKNTFHAHQRSSKTF